MSDDEDELARIDVKTHILERGLVGLGRVDERDVSQRDGRRTAPVDLGCVLEVDGRKRARRARLRLDVA